MTRDYSKFTLTPTSTPAAAKPAAPSELQHLGWQPFFSQQISLEELADTPPVRVVEVHRTALHVRGEGIDTELPLLTEVTVGDWLLLDPNTPQHSRLLERKSLLHRRAPGTERVRQLIAANIDTVFIVSSCNADFNVARLERYIALCFEAEITPVIVLTKADLVADVADYVAKASALSEDVMVVTLDARSEEPLEKLGPWCGFGKTIAFLGSSGVGKSTLTNALAGDTEIATGAIREADARGRHTTTRRQLHLVPGGCAVLDTPGMREVQLADVSGGIDALFADLTELATHCRFRDCAHQTEPGCALRAAVAAGEVDQARLDRWHKLVAEEAFNSASLSERRMKDRAFGKVVKRAMQQKNRGRR